MKHYRVIWEIDIWADNVEEAAKEALHIQRNKDSTAVVFTVKPDRGTPIEIDLESGEVKQLEK